MWLSQDAARFSMIPSLRTPLGLTGHRPVVGHLAGHDWVDVFGALTLVTGPLTTRMVDHRRVPKKQPKPPSRQRRWQAAVARHVREIARADPAEPYPRVVLVIDNASWPKGALISAVLNEWPPVEVYRWPSYRPQLQVIERFWRVWRRRAPHNRLLTPVGALQQALRNSLRDDQTLRHRVLSGIQSPKKRTKLSVA